MKKSPSLIAESKNVASTCFKHYFFMMFSCFLDTGKKPCQKSSKISSWLVVWTLLKNISQLFTLFPRYGKKMFQTTNQSLIFGRLLISFIIREHPHKIWSYMVQYLHFRILKSKNIQHLEHIIPLYTIYHYILSIMDNYILYDISFLQKPCIYIYHGILYGEIIYHIPLGHLYDIHHYILSIMDIW